MSIKEIILERGISEVLHFTTNRGCLGVLATQFLKARKRLNDDETLSFILKINAKDRSRDCQWHDYVNLSISRINTQFFKSSGAQHQNEDLWWCILAFRPEVLEHPGVYFTTTNNMYSGVKRELGVDGLNALFSSKILQYRSQYKVSEVERKQNLPTRFTTCEQAEALYPGELSTDFLQAIYVAKECHEEEVAGQLGVVSHRKVDIIVDPAKFKEFR